MGTDAGILESHLELYQCPKCSGSLALGGDEIRCEACAQKFPLNDGIAMLFWPQDAKEGEDVTETVKEFYEETPFPDYDDFDSVASLQRKAREGVFARALDQQLPSGVTIIECGCGTGQLSNFLSIGIGANGNRPLHHGVLEAGSRTSEHEVAKRDDPD